MSFPKNNQRNSVPSFDDVMAEPAPKAAIPSFEDVMVEKKNPAGNDYLKLNPDGSQSSSSFPSTIPIGNQFNSPFFSSFQPASTVVAKIGNASVNLESTAPAIIADRKKYAENLRRKLDSNVPLSPEEFDHVKAATGLDDDLATMAINKDPNFTAAKTIREREKSKSDIVSYLSAQDGAMMVVGKDLFPKGGYDNYDLEDPKNVERLFARFQSDKKEFEAKYSESNPFDPAARAASSIAGDNLKPDSPFIKTYNKLKDWKSQQIADDLVKKGVVDPKQVGLAIQNATDQDKTDQYWKSHLPSVPTGSGTIDAARVFFKSDTPLQDYELENTGADYLKKSLEQEASRKKILGQDNQKEIEDYAGVVKAQEGLYDKYPDVRYGQIVAAISNAKASEEGLTIDTENYGVASRIGYVTTADDVVRLAKENGLYDNPRDKKLVDKIASSEDINPLLSMFLPGVFLFKKATAPIENVSFAGQFTEGVKGVASSTGKSIVDLAQLRGNGTISAEQYNDDIITSWKKDQSNLDGTQKTIALIGTTTGQIVGQALTTLAFSGAGKAASLAQESVENLGFWASGALSSYDDAKKSMLDLTKSDAKAEVGALLIGFVNAASEKIFKDTKVFGDVFGKRVGNILNNIDEDKLYTEATRSTIVKALKSDFPEWAKNYVVEGNKEAFEEFATAVLQDVTEAALGDNKKFDVTKTWENARDTYVNMLVGGSVAAGIAARTNVKMNPNAATSLYHASENPNFYISSIQQLKNTNQLSEEEANRKIQIINTATKINSDLAGVDGLNARQKAAYISYRTTQAQMMDMASKTSDPVLKAKLDENIKVIDEQKNKILGGLQFNEKLEPLDNLYDQEQKYKKAEQVASESGDAADIDAAKKAKEDYANAVSEYYKVPIVDNNATVSSAVINVNGNTYEGSNHAEAILNAKAAGEDISNVDRQGDGMFKLSDGTVINRAEALSRFGKDRSELLIPQNENAVKANLEYAKTLLPESNPALFGTPEEKVRFIAEKAQNVQRDGTLSNLSTPEKSYEAVSGQFGKKLVDAAIAAHPLESLLNNSSPSNQGNESEKQQTQNAQTAGQGQKETLGNSNTTPGNSGVVNEPDITVGDMIDKTGTYKGQPGQFIQDGQTVVFKVEGQNREYELGNIDEVKNEPIGNFDITHQESVVSINDNGNVSVRGNEYKNSYSNPLAAINRDENGNIVSVNLETPDGEKRTFRGNVAEDLAYQIHLKEINKNNETRSKFEQFINEDQSSRQEIDNAGVSEAATQSTATDNGAVQREKISPKKGSVIDTNAKTPGLEIAFAPYRERNVNSDQEDAAIRESAEYKQFQENVEMVATALGIKIIDKADTWGGYVDTETGRPVQEVSNVIHVDGTPDQARLMGAILGKSAPELQDTVLVGSYSNEGSGFEHTIKTGSFENAKKALSLLKENGIEYFTVDTKTGDIIILDLDNTNSENIIKFANKLSEDGTKIEHEYNQIEGKFIGRSDYDGIIGEGRGKEGQQEGFDIDAFIKQAQLKYAAARSADGAGNTAGNAGQGNQQAGSGSNSVQPAVNNSTSTQGFFSDTVNGSNQPKKPWKPLLPLQGALLKAYNIWRKFRGGFDSHIETSIPAFRDIQIRKINAISSVLKNGGTVIDLGGSEGGFGKTITSLNPKIKTINLDMNPDMQKAHEANPVKGADFAKAAFGEDVTMDDGTVVQKFVPKEKADVVHESMLFQFIMPERQSFIDEIADNYVKPNGVVMIEEKVVAENWNDNEQKKDTDFKSNYYDSEQIKKKGDEVLVGMKGNQAEEPALLQALSSRFKYVYQYWDAGNFKGYIASNDKIAANNMLRSIGNTKTDFTSRKNLISIEGAVQKNIPNYNAASNSNQNTTASSTTAPSSEQQLKDVRDGNVVTFTYKSESEVPEVFKDKISSKGETNGEKFVRVTVAKSLADYELSKQEVKSSTTVSSEAANTDNVGGDVGTRNSKGVSIKIENLATKESPFVNISISTPEQTGHASIRIKEDGKAYISDIQIGDFTDNSRGKGYGLEAYIQIAEHLDKLGYTLESTQWDKHNTAISPQALRVWEKMVSEGYAKVIGQKENKVYNRETGLEEVKTTNVYEFVQSPQKQKAKVDEIHKKLDAITKNFVNNGKTQSEAERLALNAITEAERQVLRDAYNQDGKSLPTDVKGSKQVSESNPRAEGIVTPEGFTNRVFESNMQLGEAPNDAHISEQGYNYRVLSQNEIDAISESGGVFAREGKQKGGNKNTKYWTKGNNKNWYGDKDNLETIRVKQDNFKEDEVVRAENVEVYNKETKQFEPLIKEQPFNETIKAANKPIQNKPASSTTVSSEPSTKYQEKAKSLADKIRNAELPQWLVNTESNSSANGLTGLQIKNALADAVEMVGKLIDTGVDIKDAIAKGLESFKKAYVDSNTSFDDKTLSDGFTTYVSQQFQVLTAKDIAESVRTNNISYKDAIAGKDKAFIDDLNKELFGSSKFNFDLDAFREQIRKQKSLGLTQSEIEQLFNTTKQLTRAQKAIIADIFTEENKTDKIAAELQDAFNQIAKGQKPKSVMERLSISNVSALVHALKNALTYTAVSNEQLEQMADYIVQGIDINKSDQYISAMINNQLSDVKQLLRAKLIIALQQKGNMALASQLIIQMADDATSSGRQTQSLQRAYKILGAQGSPTVRAEFARRAAEAVQEKARAMTESYAQAISEKEAEIGVLNQKLHEKAQKSSLINKIKETIANLCNLRNKK